MKSWPSTVFHFLAILAISGANLITSTPVLAPGQPIKVYLPFISRGDQILPPIIPATTKVMPPETMQYLVSISPSGNYTFSKSTSALDTLKPGSVMVAGISSNTPDGLLRKVTSVTHSNGNVTVQTQEASLTDAIQQGSIRLKVALNPSDMAPVQVLPGVHISSKETQAGVSLFHYDLSNVVLYDKDGDNGTTNDQIRLSGGYIDVNPTFEFNSDISNFSVKYIYAAGGAVETAKLPVEAGVTLSIEPHKLEKELAKFESIVPITVMVSGVPVEIRPTLSVTVGVSGEITDSITATVTQTTTVTAGAEYSDGKWKLIKDPDSYFTFDPPKVKVGATVKGYVTDSIGAEIDGIVTPEIGIGEYLKLEAAPLANPWWSLLGGLEATVDIDVHILSLSLLHYSTSATLVETVLAHASVNHPPDAPINPNPPNGSVGQGIAPLLSWTGKDADGDPLTYTVYLDENNLTPTTTVSKDQSGNTYQASGLKYNTTYYWKVVAKDLAGSTAISPVWRFTSQASPYSIGAQGIISSGDSYTCGLIESGVIKCWGLNDSGQLGDGSSTNSSTPTQVTGLATAATLITAGWDHTCALTSGGEVKCWGNNSDGELGDSSLINRFAPVDVVGLSSGVKSISAGGFHTCALTTGGGVKCWGGNYDGQLGDGTFTKRLTPVNVTGLSSGVSAIAAGENFVCALTTTGAVKCWGANYYGQLGDGTTQARLTPVNVVGLSSGVVAIATGGNFTCALTTGGGVKCWGLNSSGQLGDGTTTDRLTPVSVIGLSSGMSAVAVGENNTCTLTSSGGVRCWGRNNFGQLGDGTVTDRLTSVGVVGLSSGVIAISAYEHTCAVMQVGSMKCWGNNQAGQLGDGTKTERHTPVDVVEFP